MDWSGLLRAGLCGLRLRPDVFWALTPIELQMMLGLSDVDAPMGSGRLNDLLAAYPDQPREKDDG